MPSAPMPPIIPLFLPHSTQVKRDCVEVNEKVYCRDDPTENRDFGMVILLLTTFVCYVLLILYLGEEKYHNGWVTLIGLIGPFFLVGLYLYFT